MRPEQAQAAKEAFDLLVVGGGPAGYLGAIRAAQLGLRTALVEREEVGGTCLNWGCIPTKTLLRVADLYNEVRLAEKAGLHCAQLEVDYRKAHARSRESVRRLTAGVESLLKRNRVALFQGTGVLAGPQEVQVRESGAALRGKNILLATGGRSKPIPGMSCDGRLLLDHRGVLELDSLPASMVVIGAGASGVEFAYLFASLGCQVTLVEMMEEILPGEDAEIAAALRKALTALGLRIFIGARAEAVRQKDGGAEVILRQNGQQVALEAEKVFIAGGVAPNVEDIGLEEVGVEVENGAIRTDARMATSVPGIYAAGDVTGPPFLAHAAYAEGLRAVAAISGGQVVPLAPEDMPRAVYCQPNVVSVGLTEAQARERGYGVRVGRFPFSASGRAVCIGHTEGLMKVVVEEQHGEILGIQGLGHEIAELLGEMVAVRGLEVTAADFAALVHAHPTMSEALAEAVLAAEGRALHL